ncbi:MAG: M48 family metalloprotease [Elusimicrobia bacterium]|nr:M48 family metalloprotease [Elusimicrobiota bacterium]
MKRFLATLIAAALILTAPGLPCYAAAGAIVSQGSVASVPAGLQGPVRGVTPVNQLSNISVGLTAIGLKGSLAPQTAVPTPVVQGFAAPMAAPSVKIDESESVPVPGPALGELNATPVKSIAGAAAAAPKLNELLGEKEKLTLTADQLGSMSEGTAKTSAASIMDRILGIRNAAQASDDAVAAPALSAAQGHLAPASVQGQSDSRVVPQSQAEPAWKTQKKRELVTALGSFAGIAAGFGVKVLIPAFAVAPIVGWLAGGLLGAYLSSRILSALGAKHGRVFGAFTTVGRVALAGGAVFGLQALAVAALPAIFGLVPVAAVWAVSSGILLLPAALYARYRLSLRDSPRLTPVKWVMDIAIGAFLGAAAIAAPSLAAIVTLQQLAAAGLPLAGLIAGRSLGSGASVLDSLGTWGALAVLPAIIGVAAAGIIGIGPLLGMMTLPVMTTLSFFLGTIIHAAETGRPFSVPGSLQKMRFPSFQWVMTGVVFALLTGLGAVYTTPAFIAWQFLGSKTYGWDKSAPLWKNLVYNVLNFNTLYLGVLAFTAATAFTSPLTFLVLAFAPERAASWTEALLGKLLPKAAPAPSTAVKPLADPNAAADKPTRWPNFHYWLKTGLLIGSMAIMGFGMGAAVFGLVSLAKNLGIAAVLAGIPFFFATKIIKLVMKTKPADESQDPEFFAIMKDLRGLINAKREAKGQKPIPAPEMVIDPLTAPNAYATGRTPFHALVGVTQGIKEMLLDGENLRAGLMRLLAASDPGSKSYKVFRMAIAESIPGVAVDATPVQVAEAVKNASAEDIKKLGVRALRGVLAHEFSHVMDRHMLLNAIAGSISSGVAFAAYGVMWAVGHAQAAAKKLKDSIFPAPKSVGDPTLDQMIRKSGTIVNGMYAAVSLMPLAALGAGILFLLNMPLLGLASAAVAAVSLGSFLYLHQAFERNQQAMVDHVSLPRSVRYGIEPISTGLSVKSLPALLRVFAALWGPIVLQITQMASSRQDEGMADADGAKLSNDPEALALALGLLTTWRPKTLGPAIAAERLPIVAANSHLFTVNPVEQMQKAGALPKSDPLSDMVVGKQDDFLFNLFITHPDTTQRIERLGEMAQAKDSPAAAQAVDGLLALDREVSGKVKDAAVKGVLATLLAAAAFFIHPVLTVGVGLVALAQYYRMVKFMLLRSRLQKTIQK